MEGNNKGIDYNDAVIKIKESSDKPKLPEEHPDKRRIELSTKFVEFIKSNGFDPNNLSSNDFGKIIKLLIRDNKVYNPNDIRFIPAHIKLTPEQKLFEEMHKVMQSCQKSGNYDAINKFFDRIMNNKRIDYLA